MEDDMVDKLAPNTALKYIPATPGAISPNMYRERYGIIWSLLSTHSAVIGSQFSKYAYAAYPALKGYTNHIDYVTKR